MTSDDSENHGKIFSVSGPVVVAEHMIGCAMYELVGDSASSDIVDKPSMLIQLVVSCWSRHACG